MSESGPCAVDDAGYVSAPHERMTLRAGSTAIAVDVPVEDGMAGDRAATPAPDLARAAVQAVLLSGVLFGFMRPGAARLADVRGEAPRYRMGFVGPTGQTHLYGPGRPGGSEGLPQQRPDASTDRSTATVRIWARTSPPTTCTAQALLREPALRRPQLGPRGRGHPPRLHRSTATTRTPGRCG